MGGLQELGTTRDNLCKVQILTRNIFERSKSMTVANILMITFGMIVITVGVPILLCVIGTFLFGFVLLILEWLADNFWL